MRLIRPALCMLAALPALALADGARDLPVVQVQAARLDVPAFDLPASISTVEIYPHDSGQPGVNFSETLVGVPGILARDRQNYAQDEQLSIRGFGARSTFGVRGVKLYVDGIPASLPDGQGQVSHVNLDSAGSVEVLRGPFSVLYGNASGGAVQVWTAPGTAMPQTTLGVDAGSYDRFRFSADTRGTRGAMDYHLTGSEFLSGGYRAHSRVHRESGNARLGFDLGDGRSLMLVANRFYQPDTQDPLGLTADQVRANSRQATAVASLYDTRKAIRQTQAGAIYEAALGDVGTVRALGYYGQRDITQVLSIPPGAQASPLQGGGFVAPDTRFGGADLRWTHRGTLADGDYALVLGASDDLQRQRRRGYENFLGAVLGVRGALRRDETDDADNTAAYVQAYWRSAPRWALLAGLRRDRVRFVEHDHYVTPTNPDDSGEATYRATTPVLGVDFRARPDLRLYASYGRGFETPTYNELGYRSDGQPGLAFDLKASHSRQLETGAKWQRGDVLSLGLAAFRADTDHELAVATNQHGRSTYRNVGRSRRDGVEFSLDLHPTPQWHLQAAWTHLRARIRDSFLACTGTPCATPDTVIPAGARIPGVPQDYGSLRFSYGDGAGWREGLTITGAGAVTVNDSGSERAAGYALLDLDAAYGWVLSEHTRLDLTLRVDNLADCRYVGSVIVNDGNGRYYESGPGRSVTLGARLTF